MDDPVLLRLASDLINASVEASVLAHTRPAELARRLLEHPEPEVWIAEHPDLRHEPVARALLEEARRTVTVDPQRAHDAAALAEAVLDATPNPDQQSLSTVAALYRANAARILGDLEAAAELLNRHHAKISRCHPPELQGDLNLLASSIRSAQDRLPEACGHLHAALTAYGPLGDSGRQALALIHAGSLLNRIGDRDGAIDAAASAAELLSPETDIDLYLAARHNLASYLILARRYDRALEILAEIGPLYPRDGSSLQVLKYRWLCAHISAATGDPRGAAGTFADIRDRLIARGLQRDAALVAIDQARLFLTEPDRFRAALEGLESLLPRRASLETRRKIRALIRGLRTADRPSLSLLRHLAHLVHTS